ncbi:MAG: DUF1489 domain-containing protein [Hyphomicrobiales bacterium]|nr:DUF1489 domain-containing protein [Hyphomicrobiales bacterium]
MLHLIKLCVGAQDVDDLHRWQQGRMRALREATITHHTRQTPKRRADILAGGSLYWVIGGLVLVRQRILDIRDEPDDEGRPKCGLVLAPELIAVAPQPRRPFQGWRYLTPEDAPADLGAAGAAMPAGMQRELAALGLL